MSNITKTFNVYKDMTYTIGMRSFGKEDLVKSFKGQPEETTISRNDMQNYVLDGITVTPVVNDSKAVIDFSNVKLPWKFEHKDKMQTSRFAIAPLGTTVTQTKYVKELNVNKVGNVQVNDLGAASGFSSSNYLRIPSQSFGSANNWEILFKVKTGNSTSTNQKVFHTCSGTGSSGRYGIGVNVMDNRFNFFSSSNKSSWLFDLTGSYTVLPNTTYYIKASFSGTQYKLSYSLDNVTFIDDIIYTSTSKVYSSLPNAFIGIYSTTAFQDPWLGTIDLNECYIKINDEEVWRGVQWVNKRLNGTTIGSLALTGDFVAGVFNNGTKYITPLQVLPLWDAESWEIQTKVKTSGTGYQGYFLQFSKNATHDGRWGIVLYTSDNGFGMDISFNGTSWAGSTTVGSISRVNDKWYYVKLTYDSVNGYKLYVSEDKTIWTLLSVNTNTTKIYSGMSSQKLGGYEPEYSYSDSLNGYLDLKECYIKMNGEEVWRGVEDLGIETLSGCVRYYYGEGAYVTTPPRDSTQYYNIYAVDGDKGVVLDSTYYHEGTMVYNRPIVTGGEIPQFENEWYLGEYRVETGEEGYILVPIDKPDTAV